MSNSAPKAKPNFLVRLRKVNSVSVFIVITLLIFKFNNSFLYWSDTFSGITLSLSFMALSCVIGVPATLYLIFLIPYNAIILYKNKDSLHLDSVWWSLLPIFISIVLGCITFLINPIADFICKATDYGKCRPFIERIEEDFDLPNAINYYDNIIIGIESFHSDTGYYPEDMSDLVPEYLSEVPSIRLRSGNNIDYSPENRYSSTPSFTFMVNGNYPGFFRGLHGWSLWYCPDSYAGCNKYNYRIDENWLWLHHSWN